MSFIISLCKDTLFLSTDKLLSEQSGSEDSEDSENSENPEGANGTSLLPSCLKPCAGHLLTDAAVGEKVCLLALNETLKQDVSLMNENYGYVCHSLWLPALYALHIVTAVVVSAAEPACLRMRQPRRSVAWLKVCVS